MTAVDARAAEPDPKDALIPLPENIGDLLNRGLRWWRCRHCGHGAILSRETRASEEARQATSHEASCPARRPLTVADIPAGKGSASLFISHVDPESWLWFKEADGILAPIYRKELASEPGEDALWALIEAHVPTVKEEPQ